MTKHKENKKFTIDNLHDIQDKYGKITLEILCKEFEHYSRRYLTLKLAEKRKRKVLDYGKDFSNIKLLKLRSGRSAEQLKRNELGRLKTWFYVQELYGLTEDLASGELKARERIKARELRTKVLKNLTSDAAVDYAKQFEEKMGEVLPWQDILD
ncbi:hypothetical protein [Streptococcus pneumoniae]|uniref:hypothetical protein n=1 Tax=Streptococcus pneumoniae TaxID=1313 RepID=UPI0007655DBE|nr:hypothetical protein [Streptococcus pneumoniae]CVU77255.1 phage protein [Streptococcus pneumoniae]CWC21073.1 phage protein [Streptococcus pneumoniae]